MSLIVPVNSKNSDNGSTPPGGGAPPGPVALSAAKKPSGPSPTAGMPVAAAANVPRPVQPQPQPPTQTVAAAAILPQTQPQPSTITITSIAEHQTQQAAAAAAVAQQQQQQHIVQHHPPPAPLAAGDTRLRMIQVPPLPQSPVRQSALPPRGHSPLTSRPPLRLPQSPVRQHQLPQVPIGVGAITAAQQQRLLAQQQPTPPPAHSGGQPPLPGIGAGAGGPDRGRPRGQPLLVGSAPGSAGRVPSPAHTLSMLPQSPSPGILPTAPSPDVLPPPPGPGVPGGGHRNLMPYPPSNLMPQPPHQSTAAVTTSTSATSKILTPSPSVLHQQLLGTRPHRMPSAVTIRGPLHPRSRHKHSVVDGFDREGSPSVRSTSAPGQPSVRFHSGGGRGHQHLSGRGSAHHSSPRGRGGGHGGVRNQIWNCLALQDHNYASRPPPTPPPSPGQVAAIAAQQAAAAAQEAAIAAAVSAAASPNTILFNPTSTAAALSRAAPGALPSPHHHPGRQPHHLQQQQPPPPPPSFHPHPPSLPPHTSSSFSSAFGLAATDLLAAAALANQSPSPAAVVPSLSSVPAAHSSVPQSSAATASPTSSGSLLPPSSMVVGNSGQVPAQPATREQQNHASIEEAGVGPMAPLEEEVAAAAAAAAAKAESRTERKARKGSGGDDDREAEVGGGRHTNEEAGEDTETAPEEADLGDDDDDDDDEEEEEDDSITRCICDFLHDDGYMICCDKCSVWQHVVCMGLDRNNIPDEYLCEVCKPRPVDRKRARALQSRRRTELFHNSSSSDDSPSSANKLNRKKMSSSSGKKDLGGRNHPQMIRSLQHTSKGKLNSGKLKGGKSASVLLAGALKFSKGIPGIGSKDSSKKQKKRKPSGKGGPADNKKVTIKSKFVRRRSYNDYEDEDEDDEDEDADSDTAALMEPRLDDSQQLRSWIDQYEEAVTNHYSPELRARLAGNKINGGIASDLRPSVIGGPMKCNVSLKGNGVKILTASTSMPTSTPIIECKGRLMLSSQFRAQSSSPSKSKVAGTDGGSRLAPAHVFLYRLGDALEICLDGRTYGNDARFCRRSSNPNAELRHVVDKGSLHLFIVTSRTLEKNQEILLPLEGSSVPREREPPLQSINADLREINKKPMNGVVGGNPPSSAVPTPTEAAVGSETPLAKDKKRKDKKKAKKAPSKEKIQPKVKPVVPKKSVAAVVDDDEDEDVDYNHSENELNGDHEGNGPASPSKSSKPSPAKMGLPDNSGLIVGVNTINYDASSSMKNKAKSREERKMEMILKAIEAMEKSEQRKKEQHGDGHVGEKTTSSATKRRRSNSMKNSQNDSNLEASSADESGGSKQEHPSKKSSKNKKGRKSGPSTPQRRRSRVLSGESASALSETEGGVMPGFGGAGGGGAKNNSESTSTPNTANSNSNSNGPFRFPKTKKSMMSDWLQESEAGGGAGSGGGEDDDVSASYLRGSRSPPGIATHLLRSAPLSPAKSVCSAKKRWLRQAISEDHTEAASAAGNSNAADGEAGVPPPPPTVALVANGNSPTSEGQADYVTPLKKRRLASYKDDVDNKDGSESPGRVGALTTEETTPSTTAAASASGDGFNMASARPAATQPNSLKKKLLHNMVLEAVLDKAMEDMLGERGGGESDYSKDEPSADEETAGEESMETKDETHEIKEEAMAEQETKVKEEESKDTFAESFSDAKPSVSNTQLSPDSSPPNNTPAAPAPAIKTPEPSSVFKSFFKSTVSIEELEKEIEATKKQRELNMAAAGMSPSGEASNESSKYLEDKKEDGDFSEKKTELSRFASQESASTIVTGSSSTYGDGLPKNEVREAAFQARESEKELRHETVMSVQNQLAGAEMDKRIDPAVMMAHHALQHKPKEKRRVSLADYKRRKKQEGSQQPARMPALANVERNHKEEGPGTPTMDEQIASGATPTLSTLPLFEKLEQLEQKQKDVKKKVVADEATAEPKREDLTERLKKEFGLTVDEESDGSASAGAAAAASVLAGSNFADVAASTVAAVPASLVGRLQGAAVTDEGDSTPELDGGNHDKVNLPPPPIKLSSVQPMPSAASGPPHPPPSGFSGSGATATKQQQGFTPTQYPSYPSNYPVAPYPKGSSNSLQSTARPPGPPHPPPPRPSSTSQGGPAPVPNYPPPPLPPSSSSAPRNAMPIREYPKEDGAGGSRRREFFTSSSSSNAGSSSSSSHSPGNRSYFEQRGSQPHRVNDSGGSGGGGGGRDRDLRRGDRDHHHRDYHHRDNRGGRDHQHHHYRGSGGSNDKAKDSRGRHGERGTSGSYRSYYGSQQ